MSLSKSSLRTRTRPPLQKRAQSKCAPDCAGRGSPACPTSHRSQLPPRAGRPGPLVGWRASTRISRRQRSARSLQERSPTSEGSRLRAPAPRALNSASEGEKVVTTDDSNESTNTWGPSSPSATCCKREVLNTPGSQWMILLRCTSRAGL
eukprot:scaffold30218_cov129-Isochrysis_galbana.AAC.2